MYRLRWKRIVLLILIIYLIILYLKYDGSALFGLNQDHSYLNCSTDITNCKYTALTLDNNLSTLNKGKEVSNEVIGLHLWH